MTDDYYALSYCAFIEKYALKFDLREDEKSKYFMTASFIFVLQMILIILLASDMMFGDRMMLKADFPTLLVRFVCAIILHIQVEKEIAQSIQMMKYYINHIKHFTRNYKEEVSACKWENFEVTRTDERDSTYWEPFVIANMQLIASISTELINIVLMCSQDNIPDTVMNFFALSVIHEIDDLYSQSLSDFKLRGVIDDLPEITETTTMWLHGKSVEVEEGKFENLEWTRGQRILRFYYKIWRTLYCGFYYYFMPMLVIVFTYTAKVWTNEANSGKGV